jgi:hypothetical protein
MKLKRKYCKDNQYLGVVIYNGKTVQLKSSGKTKREAIIRLRKMFADIGFPTRPSSLVDLLTVTSIR